MKLLYKKSFVFILAGMAYLVGGFFSNPGAFGLCAGAKATSYICGISSAINIGWSLIAFGQYLAIIGIIMLLTNANIFRKWLKFSMYYVPIAVLLDLIIYPISFSPFGEPPLTYSQGIYPFGKLYIILTASIVLVAWIRVFWKRHLKSDLNK